MCICAPYLLVPMFMFPTFWDEITKHESLQCGPHKNVSVTKLPIDAGTAPYNPILDKSLQIKPQALLAPQLCTIRYPFPFRYECMILCGGDHDQKQIHIRSAFHKYVVRIYFCTHVYAYISWCACLAPKTCHYDLQSNELYNSEIGKDEMIDRAITWVRLYVTNVKFLISFECTCTLWMNIKFNAKELVLQHTIWC